MRHPHTMGEPPHDRTAAADPIGHRSRLAEWFVQWRRPVGAWLAKRSAVPAADIEDLAQEVFLRLLRYSDDVAIGNPQGYLFRIAANVANEWQERARQRIPHDDSWLAGLQIDSREEPENQAARAMVRESVREAVSDLPPRQREVLVLHIDDGLTCPQIAERLGVTERIVQRELVRAYSRLRTDLDIEEFGSMTDG